jgi:hypothetical protein
VSLQEKLRQSPTPGRAIHNAAHVSLVKDEGDVIYASLAASYRNGLRKFVISDNLSSDNTRGEIERFSRDNPECIVYVITDPVVGYYQAAKMTALARFAATVFSGIGAPVDWVFALDADEILFASDSRYDLFEIINGPASEKKKILAYYFCNASSSELHEEIDPKADLEWHFDYFSTYHGSPVRKVAFRFNEAAYLEQGNHFCSGCVTDYDQLLVGAEFGLVLKHFPIRSITHIEKKIVNGGKALAALSNVDSLGQHWKRDYEAFLEKGHEYLRMKMSQYHEKNSS